MTTFFLIREAETASTSELSAESRSLSKKGQTQANNLIPMLGRLGIQYLYASQDRSAIDTVQPFAQVYGLPILVLSELQAQRDLQEDAAFQQKAWADFDLTSASSESNRKVQRRIVQSIHTLMLHHLNDVVAVVMPTAALALFLNAIDAAFTFQHWQEQGIPDIIRLVKGEYKISWTRIDHPRPPLALVRNQDSLNPF